MGKFSELEASMTFEKIAEETGMTMNNVHHAYRRAMQKIRGNPEAIQEFKDAVELKTKRLLERSI